jgi:hypothetical protein
MSITGDQQTNIEIRRDVNVPRGERVAPDSPMGILLDDAKLARTNVDAGSKARETYDARVAVHNGAPNDVYEANVELRKAELAENESGARVRDWIGSNLERLDAETTDARTASAERMIEALDGFEIELHEIARRDRALALVHAGKSDGNPMSTSSRERIAGGESLHNFRAGLRSLIPSEPVERVSSVEYRERRDAGEDMSRVRIVHSPDGLLPRGAGLG